MKRKMIGAAAAYMSGLFFASFFTGIFAAVMIICAAVFTTVFAVIRRFRTVDIFIIAVSFTAAFSVNRLYTIMHYDIVTSYIGCIGSFSGEIEDQTIYGEKALYVLDGRINGVQKAKVIMYTADLDAEYGDIVTIETCQFSGIKSDYLFDSKTWNKSRHIFLEAEKTSGISVEHSNSGNIRTILSDFREKMIFSIRSVMGEDEGGFLSGMIFGEKRYLDNNLKNSLYRSGIGHILAVSGLHMSIIACLIMLILKKLRVNKFIRFGIMNVAVMFILALADFPISAIRSVLMLEIAYSAELFCQQNDSFNSLSAAVLAICISDPYVLYSSGFILSVSGTFGIAVFAPYMTENIGTDTIGGKISTAFVTALCTSLAVMPASIYYFDEVSLISPLTNIILVPLCTASMVLGLLFTVTGGIFTFLLYPAEMLISLVLKTSDAISSVNFFHMPKTGGILPLLLIISAGIVICLYLFSGNKRALTMSISVVIALNTIILAISRSSREKQVTIAVLGRNSNMSAVVSYSGQTIVADLSGNYKSPEYVRKYLAVNGADHVDSLIITSHVQSQYAVYEKELEMFSPDKIYSFGGTPVYCGNSEAVGANEIKIESPAYKLIISEERLSVSTDHAEVTFLPAKSETYVENGLAVYYGNRPESRDHSADNEIFLDSGNGEYVNNFEIILSSDGQYSIRRL